MAQLDELLAGLKTAAELGVPYVCDALTADAPQREALTVHTQLADPAQCGRRAHGWSVQAGVPEAYTHAVLRNRPMLGNRSQLAQFSFCSTQTGGPPGRHGLVEMRLCRGTTPDEASLA